MRADRSGEVDVERAAGLEPVLGGEPGGDVGAVGDAVLAQDLGGVLRDGEAVDPAAGELLPGAGEGARGVGLAGAGGADELGQGGVAGRDADDGGALVGADRRVLLGRARSRRRRRPGRAGRARSRPGGSGSRRPA